MEANDEARDQRVIESRASSARQSLVADKDNDAMEGSPSLLIGTLPN
jgi:hypothetical protein